MEKIYTAIDLFDSRGFRAHLRVAVVPWKGVNKVHIREYVPSGNGFRPGRGIAFNMDCLDRVVYALQLLQKDREKGLFDERSADGSGEPDDEVGELEAEDGGAPDS